MVSFSVRCTLCLMEDLPDTRGWSSRMGIDLIATTVMGTRHFECLAAYPHADAAKVSLAVGIARWVLSMPSRPDNRI